MEITITNSEKRGPLLIGLGLILVLAAQMIPEIPLATAMAVIGLGATFTLRDRRHHELVLQLNLLVYAAIVSLTIGAQYHAHANIATLADAATAIALLARALTTAIPPHQTP